MSTILNNPTLSTIFIVACTIFVMALQHFFGYKNWKPLGFLFPLLLIGFVIYFFARGMLTINIIDIFMPIIGLLVLGSAYERGYRKAKEKQNKELERMKAQDNL